MKIAPNPDRDATPNDQYSPDECLPMANEEVVSGRHYIWLATCLALALACTAVGYFSYSTPSHIPRDAETQKIPDAEAILARLFKDEHPDGAIGPEQHVVLSPDELFLRCSPAVVRVLIQDADGRTIGAGSGFLAGSKDQIVTNHHVMLRAHEAYVLFANGVKAKVLGISADDEEADLSILKLDRQVESRPLVLSESGPPVVGTRVYAIGSPRGLTNTLSEGLVSGVRRDGTTTEIQTSAPISPGSSGGPLLTAEGKVVGVTTSGFRDGQNLNFAIPSSGVLSLLRRSENPKQLTVLPLGKQDTAASFLKSGDESLERKEFDKAIRDYDEAIRLDPKSVLSYAGRASAWMNKKEFDKAIDDCDEVIRMVSTKGKKSSAYICRAMVWAQKKVYYKALEDLDEAIRLDPSNNLATSQRENVVVEQIRSRLVAGLTQKQTSGTVEVLADKPKPDESEVLFEGDRVADFKYVERNSFGYVARYFPIKDVSGKPTTRFRLNLLYSKGFLRNWYVLME